MEVWTGTILPVAFAHAPEDWAMAHGQTLTVSQHPSLFSLIGNTYGGNPRVDFKLPDLRARVPVGFDDRKAGSYGLGRTAGAESAVLTSNNLPAHTHAARFEPVKSTATVQIPAQNGNLKVTPKLKVSSAGGGRQTAQTGDRLGASSSPATKIYTDTSTSPVDLEGLSADVSGMAATPAMTGILNDMVVGGMVTVSPAGASQPTPLDTRMPYLAINFIICLQGIFPPKP